MHCIAMPFSGFAGKHGQMQKLWKVVLGKGVVAEHQGAMIRQRQRHPEKSLRKIAEDLARYGVTNGGGAAYHPWQIKELVRDGAARMHAYLRHRPLDDSRQKAALLLREKAIYSRSTESDPYLHGRLAWWRLRRYEEPAHEHMSVWERTVEYLRNR